MKTKVSNRIFSLLMAVFMVLVMLPPVTINVHAESETTLKGKGTSDDPYQISDYAQLVEFEKIVNEQSKTEACAVLTADIIANDGTFSLDENNKVLYNGMEITPSTQLNSWTPIGPKDKPYTGTFNGQGHTIKGLYIKEEKEDYVGLFGHISSGDTVTNLGLEGGYICGHNYVGGVCGYNNGGTITDCYNTETVSGTYGTVGGVCGYNNGGTIESCYNTGAVTGDSNYVGGVCGCNESSSTIENCYYNNEICTHVTQAIGNQVRDNVEGLTTIQMTGTEDNSTEDDNKKRAQQKMKGFFKDENDKEKNIWKFKADTVIEKDKCYWYYPTLSESNKLAVFITKENEKDKISGNLYKDDNRLEVQGEGEILLTSDFLNNVTDLTFNVAEGKVLTLKSDEKTFYKKIDVQGEGWLLVEKGKYNSDNISGEGNWGEYSQEEMIRIIKPMHFVDITNLEDLCNLAKLGTSCILPKKSEDEEKKYKVYCESLVNKNALVFLETDIRKTELPVISVIGEKNATFRVKISLSDSIVINFYSQENGIAKFYGWINENWQYLDGADVENPEEEKLGDEEWYKYPIKLNADEINMPIKIKITGGSGTESATVTVTKPEGTGDSGTDSATVTEPGGSETVAVGEVGTVTGTGTVTAPEGSGSGGTGTVTVTVPEGSGGSGTSAGGSGTASGGNTVVYSISAYVKDALEKIKAEGKETEKELICATYLYGCAVLLCLAEQNEDSAFDYIKGQLSKYLEFVDIGTGDQTGSSSEGDTADQPGSSSEYEVMYSLVLKDKIVQRFYISNLEEKDTCTVEIGSFSLKLQKGGIAFKSNDQILYDCFDENGKYYYLTAEGTKVYLKEDYEKNLYYYFDVEGLSPAMLNKEITLTIGNEKVIETSAKAYLTELAQTVDDPEKTLCKAILYYIDKADAYVKSNQTEE